MHLQFSIEEAVVNYPSKNGKELKRRNFLPFLVDEQRANAICSPEFASRHHAGLQAVVPALLLTEIVTAKSLVVGICVVLLVRKASEWSDPED